MASDRIYSFDPVIDSRCRVLILGTMPGVMSLTKAQYYGNERNAFWRIVHALFDETPSEEYEERKTFLLRHHIALWDVLSNCEREGSLDSDIRKPEPNNFERLFREYPLISTVCFNGGPAAKLYDRLVERTSGAERGGSTTNGSINGSRQYYNLPSTSPAYTIPFEAKLEKWRLLTRLLES